MYIDCPTDLQLWILLSNRQSFLAVEADYYWTQRNRLHSADAIQAMLPVICHLLMWLQQMVFSYHLRQAE